MASTALEPQQFSMRRRLQQHDMADHQRSDATRAIPRCSSSCSSSSSTSSSTAPSVAADTGQPRRQPARRPKQQTPQEAVDEFWANFTSKTPGKATTVIPQNPWTKKIAHRHATIPTTSVSLYTSYETAAAMCRAKVDKIVKECRRINKKYRDLHFDIETDLKRGFRDCLESLACTKSGKRPGRAFKPKSAKRVPDIFDRPQFYIDGPTANDVRQGRDGDCWLLAALCTLSNKKGLIERLCVAHDQDVGVYGFVFFRDGEWVSEIVDDFLYLTKDDYDEGYLERVLLDELERGNPEEAYRRIYQTNSNALYFAQCQHPQETWLPLLEKAYAKAHGDFASIEGGFGGEGIEDLTGGVTSELYTTDILDKEYFWREELMKVNEDFLFGCSTGVWGTGWGDREGIIELHAYSIQKAVEVDGKRLLKLKNPWGKGGWKGAWSDGSKEWTPEWLEKLGHRFGDNGDFWITYQDLLHKYQAFERTRLFGPDWRMTQTWTTLSVPWTLEYHDTRFCFSLPRKGPVVIVLAQLDDRYYRGLQGQYHFVLALRLHKAGHQDYLVRSERPYRMSRSVNVELELETGDYEVRVRLDTTRDEDILPVDEVLRNNVKMRREKMIRVGMNYDLAHSKGWLEETAEEKAAKEKREKKKKEEQRKLVREQILAEREETHYLRAKGFARQQKAMQRQREKKRRQIARRRAKREEARGEMAGDWIGDRMPRGIEAPRVGEKQECFSMTPEIKIEEVDKAAMDLPSEETRAEPANADPAAPEIKFKEVDKVVMDLPSEETRAELADAGSVTHEESETTATHESPQQPGDSRQSDTPPQPDITQQPDSPGQPDVPQQSDISQQSGISQQPGSSQQPDITQQPDSSERPDVPQQPDISQQPGIPPQPDIFQQPDSSEWPDVPQQPDISQQPGIPPQPDIPQQHDSSEWPDVPQQPDISQQPGIPQQPDIPQQPNFRRPMGEQERQSFQANPSLAGSQESRFRRRSFCESEPSVSDDDLSSYGPLSDISDRELEIQVDSVLNRQNNPAPAPTQPPPPRREGLPEMPDEFELNPWNAVAVVGLRIYSKFEQAGSEQAPDVTLKVVRSNPHLDEDDEGKNGQKQEDAKTAGLDVDDAVKDATLEGGEKERKESIMGDAKGRK